MKREENDPTERPSILFHFHFSLSNTYQKIKCALSLLLLLSCCAQLRGKNNGKFWNIGGIVIWDYLDRSEI
jgi:hypothetical protein